MLFFLVIANLLLAFIRPQDYLPELAGIPIVPVFLLAAMAAWLFARQKNLDGPNGLLVALLLIVTTFSHIANGWVGGALQWFPPFAITCVMFFLTAAASSSTRRVRGIMLVFVVCGALIVLHGMQQVVTGVGWTGEVPIQGRIRYIGILNDPNDMGLFLVMGIPFILLFMRESGGFIGKLFWLALLCFFFGGIYFTQSRGTMLAAMAILGIMFYRRYGFFLAGCLAVPLFVGAAFLPERMTDLSAGEASANTRVEAWYAATQMLETNPLFGVGAGRFTDYHGRTAHNTYLLVLAENGVIGFFVFVALMGYAVLMTHEAGFRRPKMVSSIHQGKMLPEHATANALFYSLLGFAIAAFFLSRAYVIFPYILFGMISGYYASLRVEDSSLQKFRLGENVLRWGAATIFLVFGFYLIVKILLLLS